MPKRKLPDTSIAAQKAVTIEMLDGHFKKICDALTALGTGTYEKIADYATMEKNQVSRRLKELEGMELVYKPGTKQPTKSGRQAYEYTLRSAGQIVEKKSEKVMEGKTVADFSKEINRIQASIF